MARIAIYPNLEAEMKRVGITQDDIGRIADKNRSTISDWMTGKTEAAFPIGVASRIRNEFFPDCSIEYLFATNGS